ncbi:hypothetical protein CFAEC_10370 [Corynebacterium faecale]|uniref:hypothetical protein n=1 Tax=Corynebacterium faecale TaxID=1758466 RepID=UPI0025B32FB8|nr:hypothetical protein [Corynebacterium faecale]WJY92887.1 hypothetical protein CFAEC_10370 [Corynebacterium faecale]
MHKVARFLTGILLSALVCASAPIASAGDMGFDVPVADCPSTVVVVARGNDSRDSVTPVRYSPQSDFVSTGWEGENIRTFLQFAENRHAAANQGQSLLADTYVLGLSEEYYPADVSIPEVTDAADLGAVLPQLGGLVTDTVSGLKNSLDVSIPGIRTAIENYETSSGCTPGYILIGYSLGATVLSFQESWLAEKGQLVGTLYLGSVHQSPGDPAVIGAIASAGGVLGRLPYNSLETARSPNRIMYCIPDDVACDPTPTAVQRAVDEASDSPHAQYFLDPESEVHIGEVADRFSSWIVEEHGKPAHPAGQQTIH